MGVRPRHACVDEAGASDSPISPEMIGYFAAMGSSSPLQQDAVTQMALKS